MTDLETISVYDSQVENYVEIIKQQPTDQVLLNFISRFKENDFILDLGCGPAQSSVVMRLHGLHVDPIDASQEMVKLANATFNINARQAVFEDIQSINTYNGIWASFSLLHAREEDLSNILNALRRALKPDGALQLNMKLGTGSTRDKLGRFYSYYSQIELSDFLTNAGFTVENIEFGEGLGLAGDIEPWIAITCVAS